MLNTYIKNKGHTQTIIHRNKQTKFNDIKWDSDYDGNKANISINADMNGNMNHFNIKLDNKDLANMLNMPTVNIPIHKRLENDFNMNRFIGDPNVYKIEIPHMKQIEHINPFQEVYHNNLHNHNYEQNNPLIELLESNKPVNYLPSPLPNEEFIIPITIDKKSHKKLMSKRHRSHRHRRSSHRRSSRSSRNSSSRRSSRNSSSRNSSSRNSRRRKYKTYRVYKKINSSKRSLKSRNSTRSYRK